MSNLVFGDSSVFPIKALSESPPAKPEALKES
jgi:hypothetical protein